MHEKAAFSIWLFFQKLLNILSLMTFLHYTNDKLMSHQLQMQNINLCLHSKLKMKLVIEPIIIRIAKQSEEEEKDPTTTF